MSACSLSGQWNKADRPWWELVLTSSLVVTAEAAPDTVYRVWVRPAEFGHELQARQAMVKVRLPIDQCDQSP
jgi:hypothetical protein